MAEHRPQWSRFALTLAFSLLITMSALSPFSLFPTAQAQAAARRPQTSVGQLNLSGNPSFDSDSIANSDPSQWRWLSYPGARLSLNPQNTGIPLDTKLTLHAGGWFYNAPRNLGTLVQAQLAPQDGSATDAASVDSTWYPYKIAYTAHYASPSGSTLAGYDYMVDANATMIRVLQDTATVPTNVVLSGTFTDIHGGKWDSTDQVLLDSNPNYNYAIHFADLRGSTLAPLTLTEVPTITATGTATTWTLTKPYASGGYLGVSIGVSAAAEGSATAVQRALNAFGSSETAVLATTKANIDGLLQRFPAPTQFGVSGVNANGVTATTHRRAYYAAADFIISDLMNPLPENAGTYNYAQELCGKPSFYGHGASPAPGVCAWDSLFGIQFLAYSMPAMAENAFAGMMSLVQSNGQISGEILPTRNAQTAWIVYNQSHDVSFLQTIYPNLKNYLLWAEQNPHWNGVAADGKDAEYVASWIYDVQFAADIANVLGNTADVSMWQNEQATMTSNYQTWFLSDPNTPYEFYYTNHSNPPSLTRYPQYMDSGLVIPGLSAASRSRLLGYFDTAFAPNTGTPPGPDKALGLTTWKYPDLSLMITGLNQGNQGTAAAELANGAVRDIVNAVQFSENVVPVTPGPMANGVQPSLFSAAGLVDQTWHLNGADTEMGPMTAFSFGSGGALSFATGFETDSTTHLTDPQPTWLNTVDNGGGSSGGLSNVTSPQLQTIQANAHLGTSAIVNSGQATGGSLDYAYMQVFDFSANPLPVSATSTLYYWIYPQSSSKNSHVSGSNSTCEAIDLIFTDGSALRNYAAAVDQNGIRIHPAYQCQHVQLDTWNLVTVNLGAAVNGKAIARLDVAYDQPGSTGGYSGFLDDIAISS